MMTVWYKIAGKWKQLSGGIKQRWGDLTHDERMQLTGQREVLAGTIQERFGVTRLKAKKQISKRSTDLKS